MAESDLIDTAGCCVTLDTQRKQKVGTQTCSRSHENQSEKEEEKETKQEDKTHSLVDELGKKRVELWEQLLEERAAVHVEGEVRLEHVTLAHLEADFPQEIRNVLWKGWRKRNSITRRRQSAHCVPSFRGLSVSRSLSSPRSLTCPALDLVQLRLLAAILFLEIATALLVMPFLFLWYLFFPPGNEEEQCEAGNRNHTD